MTRRIALGPIADLPGDHCVAIDDGSAVAVRVGDDVRCYRNECVHQESPIAGGIVRDGVLSCPLHFWRYHVDDGVVVGGRRALDRYPVEIVDGECWALLPDHPRPMSLRQQLLARAQTYDRDEAFRADRHGEPSSPL